MGLFKFLSERLRARGAVDLAPVRPQAAIQRLEQRILFAVQVNTNVFDGPPPSGTVAGWPAGEYADQGETTNATFSMPGSSSNQVAVAYNDGAMLQYQQLSDGTFMHQTGWAYSSNGGQSFVQPSTDPANPVVLPTVPNGTQTTGDDANHSLAWDNANATLYMASTSWPNQSDINVYESTDGGPTFLAGVDATPGAPTTIGSQTVTYDKPWLAVDNYFGTGDGTGYGALYLAYVEIINNSQTNIYLTGLSPGASFSSTSWPTPLNNGDAPGFVLQTTGLVQSPEVLVEPDHSVDVVYTTGEGIYLVHSDSPLSLNGWTNSQPKELVAFQYTNGYNFWSDDLYANVGGGTTKETIVDIPHYPSTAIGQIGTDTYLYAAYMDGNLSGDQNDQPDGTFGIYFLQYDLTHPQQLPLTPGRVAQDANVTDQWMPSLALSPDGSYAFIGFYGGNGIYDPVANTADEQYNTFYIAGATNASGPNWGSPIQITNVDGTGQPTGGYFNQPGGPSIDDFWTNPAAQWRPDYDSASADYQNFHYSFMETSNEQVYDASGDPVTLDAQEDVYMANIAIPYTGAAAPQAPTVVQFTQNTSVYTGTTFTVRWDPQPYQDQNLYNDFAYVEYSIAGQGWLPFGRTPARVGNGFLTLSSGDPTFPNYSPGTTYYFRVRVQGTGVGDASSGWSTAFVAPGSNTMVIYGTPGSDTIVMTEDPVNNQIDYTIGGNAQTPVSIIPGGSLLMLGGGGAEQITFDLSNGNFLPADTEIDNDGGSMSLEIVGVAGNNTVNIVGGGNAPYQFDGTYVKVVAGLLTSLEYVDGGGNDTITASGAIPVMLNLSTGDSTIINSDSAPVYVVPGTGKINLSADAGPTIIPPSTANAGIRDVAFAAINIAAGAKVIFDYTGATFGDLTNHANRTLAIVDAGGLNIASGGVLDMSDNSMLLKYLAANKTATDTMVNSLLTSGYAGGAWDGTGIMSSEASYNAYYGNASEAVGWADQYDVGVNSFEGDSADVADGNEIMIKFTYYGDTDLNGMVASSDSANFSTGVHLTGNAYWEFGDFDYSGGTPTASDSQLFSTGFAAYRAFGQL